MKLCEKIRRILGIIAALALVLPCLYVTLWMALPDFRKSGDLVALATVIIGIVLSVVAICLVISWTKTLINRWKE